MAGELVPHRGQIFHDDLELSAIDDSRRRSHRIQNIGFVFQDFPLVPYLPLPFVPLVLPLVPLPLLPPPVLYAGAAGP